METNEIKKNEIKKEINESYQESEIREQEQTSIIDKPNSNELAIYIVKMSKIFFEAYFTDEKKKESLKDIIVPKTENGKEFRDFSLNLFDETWNYYIDLKNYFDFRLEYLCLKSKKRVTQMRSLIKSNVSRYYFSILLDLLLEILENNPSAHKDDIIKFDITIICEFFREKNERLFSSHSFFYCCVKELMEKYKVEFPKKNEFRKNFFELCKNKASATLQEVKNNLDDYIKSNLDYYCTIIYDQWKRNRQYIKNEEDESKCKLLHDKYEKMEKIASSEKNNYFNSKNELMDWCEKNEIDKYFDDYSVYLTKKKFFNNEADKISWKKHVYEDCLLPSGIFSINEENEDNIYIISSIDYNKNLYYSELSDDGKTFYEQYQIAKEELNYLSQKCYKEEIRCLINDDSFIKEFFSVFQSKSVSKYLNSVIQFNNDKENDYEVKLEGIPKIGDKIDQDALFELTLKGDMYLGEQYDSFVKDMKNDFTSFRKLIVIKELGFKLPACTGPSMRIFINPRLQFSKEAIDDDLQRKNLLKSALIILLIHEITHLLKYYPLESKYPKNTPQTPKNKENGKCLMFYLFKKAIIDKINVGQSCQINKVNNWENLGTLNEIFQNNNGSNNSEGSNHKDGELDLYSSNYKIVKSKKSGKKKVKTDYCWWW